jgi:hypothetical protein
MYLYIGFIAQGTWCSRVARFKKLLELQRQQPNHCISAIPESDMESCEVQSPCPAVSSFGLNC